MSFTDYNINKPENKNHFTIAKYADPEKICCGICPYAKLFILDCLKVDTLFLI